MNVNEAHQLPSAGYLQGSGFRHKHSKQFLLCHLIPTRLDKYPISNHNEVRALTQYQ
jgi:hypothetical protein